MCLEQLLWQKEVYITQGSEIIKTSYAGHLENYAKRPKLKDSLWKNSVTLIVSALFISTKMCIIMDWLKSQWLWVLSCVSAKSQWQEAVVHGRIITEMIASMELK